MKLTINFCIFILLSNSFFVAFTNSKNDSKALSKDIVLIAVTNRSLKEVGTYPWTRDKYANLIEVVYSYYKPKVFFHSFIHDLPSREHPKGDNILAKTLKGKKNLLLAATMGGKQTEPAPHISASISKVHLDLTPPSSIGGLFPISKLSNTGAIMAITTKIPAYDEYYNHLPTLFKIKNKYYTSVSVIAACKYLNLDFKNLTFTKEKIISKNQSFEINQYGFFEVNFNGSFQEFDYIDVLNKKVNQTMLKDKIVIFSSKATGWTTSLPTKKSLQLNDIYLTAYGIQTILDQLR